MDKILYLRQVTAILAYKEAKEGMERLADILKKSGIRTKVYGADAHADQNEKDGDAWPVQLDGYAADGCLWITDSSYWARRLEEEGRPLLVYFHEGNRGEDFPVTGQGMEKPWELESLYFENVYRRFAGIPWDIVETSRCLVRETVTEDVEAFKAIYSDPEVLRFTREQYPDTVREKEYVKEYIKKQYGFYNFGVWTIVLKRTGEVIGRAGFFMREGYEPVEMGYVIGSPWQRQGIAYEVCSAILEYIREELGFEMVQTMVEKDNAASLALCHKLGFEKKETVWEEGVLCVRWEKRL